MADKIRVNKKTGKTQYRVRYLWKDADGKRKDSMTGWFDSLKDAQNSAEILKYRKEELARQEKNLRAVTQIKTAFTRYVEDLGKKASAETMDNTTSDVSRFQRARTVLRYYLPNSIAYQSTRDITATTFRTWMEYINKAKGPKEKELSGNTVRQYRETLSGFNNYLANNGYYIDNELDILIDNTLTRMNIKPRRAGKRTRYCFTIGEMYVVFSNYTSVGLGDFQEFYWYTLFMVLFFSGMRSEEIIGLTWKNVHLEDRQPYIDVCNAISEREDRRNVMRRMEAGIYHTKNNNSDREIPILEVYYDVLEAYRRRMKVEFSIDELGDYFVFPNINAKDKRKRATDYQKQKNILRELDRVCRVMGLPKTDVQMIRHACATWLVSDVEHGGMGYEESRARDYFGHTSDEMLRSVYAKLGKKQRANRTSETFKEITKKHVIGMQDEEIEIDKDKSHHARSIIENSEAKFTAICYRIKDEILKDIAKGRKEYHYILKDAMYVRYVIMRCKEEGRNLEEEIKFIQDKDEMDAIHLADLHAENKALKEGKLK